jgi:hypothetical protein
VGIVSEVIGPCPQIAPKKLQSFMTRSHELAPPSGSFLRVHAAAGCAGAQTETAPCSLYRCAGAEHLDARTGGAAIARTTYAGYKARRVRGGLCARRPVRLSWAKLLKRVPILLSDAFAATSAVCAEPNRSSR